MKGRTICLNWLERFSLDVLFFLPQRDNCQIYLNPGRVQQVAAKDQKNFEILKTFLDTKPSLVYYRHLTITIYDMKGSNNANTKTNRTSPGPDGLPLFEQTNPILTTS